MHRVTRKNQFDARHRTPTQRVFLRSPQTSFGDNELSSAESFWTKGAAWGLAILFIGLFGVGIGIGMAVAGRYLEKRS